MGDEVGFDVPRLKSFAADVGRASPGLGTLEHDIAGLRDRARPLLDRTMPSESYNPYPPPGTTVVGPGLLDLETEIGRRIDIIEGLAVAESLGMDVDFADAFALDLVDDEAVEGARDEIRELLTKDTGSNGNRDDIEHVLGVLDDLSAEELDAVVDGLSDDELSQLGGMVSDTDDSGWKWWDHNGLERWQRMEFYGVFLSQVSPSRIDRLTQAWPDVNPGFESTDVYLDGENAQTGENATGIHWGVPEGEVFELDEDGRPVVDTSQADQGQFADCWFIASVLATQGADPDFIPEHMRQNPNGTVSVQMYDDDGDPHWVTVTQDLPLDESGDPVGVESDPGLLWGAYYEKAFALVYADDGGGAPDDHEGDSDYDRAEEGTYAALEWDQNTAAAPYLTGQDADDLGHDFDEIQSRFGDGDPVIVSTPGEAPDPPDEWGNAYSTRHVYYVTGVDGDTITVGNPWGASYPEITMTREEFDDYFDGGSALGGE